MAKLARRDESAYRPPVNSPEIHACLLVRPTIVAISGEAHRDGQSDSASWLLRFWRNSHSGWISFRGAGHRPQGAGSAATPTTRADRHSASIRRCPLGRTKLHIGGMEPTLRLVDTVPIPSATRVSQRPLRAWLLRIGKGEWRWGPAGPSFAAPPPHPKGRGRRCRRQDWPTLRRFASSTLVCRTS
jgi:hypothetical protein